MQNSQHLPALFQPWIVWGYLSNFKMSKEFGKDWNTEILSWARQVEEDSNTEKQIEQQIGLVARKPVIGVSNKASFKPVSSATETS